MAARWVSLRRATIGVARRTGRLEDLLAARRAVRRRRALALARLRRRRFDRSTAGAPRGSALVVRSGDHWMLADQAERFVAHELMIENLDRVIAAFEQARVPHFWCPNPSDQLHRIGVPDDARAHAWRALVAADLGPTTYLRPAGLPLHRMLPLTTVTGRGLAEKVDQATVWTVFRAITSSAHTAPVGPAHGVQIEFWRLGIDPTDEELRDPAAETLRDPLPQEAAAEDVVELVTDEQDAIELARTDARDMGLQVTPRLICRRPNQVTSVIGLDELGSGAVVIGGRSISTTKLFGRHHATSERFEPVDVVYTWVDGDDAEWQQRRGAYEHRGASNHNADGRWAARFTNRGELRYSLRSLHQYADFVRHVYLVTDRQVPAWLDTDAPGISVVDHKEIFGPDDALPTFNSHAIEARIHRIPGLSEHYLYLNDDVFFGRRVTPALFFWPNGMSKFFLSRVGIPSGPARSGEPSVTSAAKNGRDLLYESVGYLPLNKLKHTPHAQRRRVVLEMEARFSDEFARIGRSRFRSAGDISVAASLHHHYGYATGTAMPGSISYQYVNLAADNLRDRLDGLLSGRWDTWCLNDAYVAPDRHAVVDRIVEGWFEQAFPFKSPFEL